jgi:stage II sporulation protein D
MIIPSRIAFVLIALPLYFALHGHATLAYAAEFTEIRVVLDEVAASQVVSGELAWSTADGATIGSSHSETSVGLSGVEVSIKLAGQVHYADRLVANSTSGYVLYRGNEYRGRLELFPGKAGGVVVLNVLALEDYLLGVVPAEMPASWPAEALRAQAVAARTYALSRMMAQRGATYDVLATESDQVYNSVSGEDPRTSQAVADTAGQILTYGGVPIVAYFSSDAGGYTRAGSEPYLRPVPCPADQSPHNGWQFELSASELSELAAAAGAGPGAVTGVTAQYDGLSGHLQSIALNTSGGSCVLQGSEFRRYVGRGVMKSTRVELAPIGAANVTVTAAELLGSASPPQAATATSFDTAVLQDYQRPWVASSKDLSGLKLRTLYASDGWDMRKCTGSLHVFTDLLQNPVAVAAPESAAQVTEIAGNGPLEGLLITGSGYGHGRGLSQWGARQMAEDGAACREILLHFYSGVELVQWNGDVPAPITEPGHGFYAPYQPGN